MAPEEINRALSANMPKSHGLLVQEPGARAKSCSPGIAGDLANDLQLYFNFDDLLFSFSEVKFVCYTLLVVLNSSKME